MYMYMYHLLQADLYPAPCNTAWDHSGSPVLPYMLFLLPCMHCQACTFDNVGLSCSIVLLYHLCSSSASLGESEAGHRIGEEVWTSTAK